MVRRAVEVKQVSFFNTIKTSEVKGPEFFFLRMCDRDAKVQGLRWKQEKSNLTKIQKTRKKVLERLKSSICTTGNRLILRADGDLVMMCSCEAKPS